MPAELENRSVRYFSTSIPLACAVEITEYKRALHFAPLAVLLKSHFLRPTVNGLIAFSARLLSMGTSPSSKNVYRYFFSLSVYLMGRSLFDGYDNSRFLAGIESVEGIGTFFPETRFQCRFSYSNQVGYGSHYLFYINGQGYPPLSLVFSICLSMTVIISLSRLSPIPLILLRSACKLS